MTDKEILLAVFNKAGLLISELVGYKEDGMSNVESIKEIFDDTFPPEQHTNFIRGIVLNHNFAKAFWDEEKVDDFGSVVKLSTSEQYKRAYPDGAFNYMDVHDYVSEGKTWYSEKQYSAMPYAWQYHLQQMVLEEEPLKYLEKFI